MVLEKMAPLQVMWDITLDSKYTLITLITMKG